jgi:hypothetical protein
MLKFNLVASQFLFWLLFFVSMFEWRFVGWQQGVSGMMLAALMLALWIWCEGRMEWQKRITSRPPRGYLR